MKSLFLFLFSGISMLTYGQLKTATTATTLDSIGIERQRIIAELKTTDTAFFKTIDSLSHYATDAKFAPSQQLVNVRSLLNYLKKVEDRALLRSGKYTDYLRFAFGVMDWRQAGTLYDNLSKYEPFAIRCATLYAEDSAGAAFIAKAATDDPDLILMSADQLPTTPYFKAMVEEAIAKDPDFAKRYFNTENAVSDYAQNSKNLDANGVYKLFDKYANHTKAYILYDAVQKKRLTVKQADSIGADSKTMLREMVKTLSSPTPLGIKSIMREMDYRAVELVRQSVFLPATTIISQFSQYSPEQQLTILAFGYQECMPRMLDAYLSVISKTDLSKIPDALIANLKSGPLPAFLRSLENSDKLGAILGSFSEENKGILQQLLASNESKHESPTLRDIVVRESIVSKTDTASLPPIAVVPIPASPTPTTKVEPYKPEPAEPADDMKEPPIHFELSDSARSMLGLQKNMFEALQNIPSFLQSKYAKAALLYAAEVEPDEVFKKIDYFKSKYWCKSIIERAALNAPMNAHRYLASATHPVTVILGFSTDPVITKFLRWSKQAEFQSRPFILLDELAKDSISFDRAMQLCEDNKVLFREMMKIATQKNYIGRYNIERELNYYALHFVRSINDHVAQPEKVRFACVDSLSCDEIYNMMVYGREEVFSATFAGMFSRLESKCASSKSWTVSRLIAYPHYRSFLALCAAYGRLDKLLGLFPVDSQKVLLQSFSSNLNENPYDLTDAATVAETIANTTNNTVLQIIQGTIKTEYLRFDSLQDSRGMVIYGILVSLCRDKAVVDKKWFVLTAKKYKIGTLTTLTNKVLADQKVFVERMYFYDDEDGRDSYDNFIKTYSADPNWRVDKYYSYVKVSDIKGKVEIYANKAELEESGEREIVKIIADNNYIVRCIVHRGHSFHTEATLNRVPSSARFIFVGSCGGFYKLNIALRKAPDAHIVSTRQIGVKEINDPIMFRFNEYVRLGRDINWRSFWDEMRSRLGTNSLFGDYVPPHRNLESLFVRAYYQIMGG